jgi:hypothetical protein
MMDLNLFQGPGRNDIYDKNMAKHKKHDKLVKDYEAQKAIHLEKLASQILKNDEKMQKLKEKNINTNFLKLF